MKDKLFYGCIATFLVSGLGIYAYSLREPDQSESAEPIQMPLANTPAGQQYGFSAGNGLDHLCIGSGMGEVNLNSSKAFTAKAPFAGTLVKLITKDGCTPCYLYTTNFSEYVLKLCGESLIAGTYAKGEVMGKGKEFTAGFFGIYKGTEEDPVKPGDPVTYEPQPAEVSPDGAPAYLRLVFLPN